MTSPLHLALVCCSITEPEAESAGLEEVVGDSEAWPELISTRPAAALAPRV